MKIKAVIKNPYTLGQVIQQSRMQRGVSQRELAKTLGISQKWIWEMEQGKPGLLTERLFAILKETGIALSAEFETAEPEKKAPDDGLETAESMKTAPEAAGFETAEPVKKTQESAEFETAERGSEGGREHE